MTKVRNDGLYYVSFLILDSQRNNESCGYRNVGIEATNSAQAVELGIEIARNIVPTDVSPRGIASFEICRREKTRIPDKFGGMREDHSATILHYGCFGQVAGDRVKTTSGHNLPVRDGIVVHPVSATKVKEAIS